MGGEDKKETGSGTRRMTSGVVGAAGRDTEGIQSSWDVEPYGSLELWFNFKSERTRRKEGGTEEGLGRKAAVRKRKGPCTEMYKHHFYTQQTYAITRCAICEEYLVNSEGLQCEDCQMFVHSKCVHKIVNSCLVGVSETEDADKHPDPVDIIKYRIPHRWDNTISLGANWCCHCGSMVTLGRRILKCVECSVVCHYTCSAFVPNFCGLRLYKAFDMLTQIQRSIVVKPTVLTSRNTTFRQARKPSAAAVKSLGSPDGQGFESLELNYKPLTSAIQAPVHSQQVQTVVAKLVPPVPPQELIPQKAAVTAFGSEDFRFLAVLGKGNFGKVMLAEERRTRGLYAIKILKKQFIAENDEFESTRSEKRVLLIANKTRHPFLIGLHSCFQTDTRIFFVMEYISGGDLMMHIQRQQFSERRAKFYACEVLLALEYFHQNNIIYRDLKLDNIMLGADGHIKIADYGLCKENMPYGATTHTFCGTPEFMAPEIVLEQRYGRPVDWWAFGVLIYEMLLGQSPFRGDDEEEIFDAILEDEVLYPVNMSRDSVSICQELLERDANKRLGSGPGDADDVKRHPFFRGINWTNILEKKVTPPFIPQISGPNDVSNFDTEFTSERPVLTVLKGYGQKGGVDKKQSDLEFSDFDYVAPWAGKTDKWTL
ncbi:Protein kinase C-like 1 [Zancudomyces culisetae]|nr:Protein kinase C-like 1 [Zancudomyces culisetae]|eukprot:OMH84592.1 Protein kinase C-like 1 [Zancudomyces culisetae]